MNQHFLQNVRQSIVINLSGGKTPPRRGEELCINFRQEVGTTVTLHRDSSQPSRIYGVQCDHRVGLLAGASAQYFA